MERKVCNWIADSLFLRNICINLFPTISSDAGKIFMTHLKCYMQYSFISRFILSSSAFVLIHLQRTMPDESELTRLQRFLDLYK